jgi:Flp pilus assembly protein TadG
MKLCKPYPFWRRRANSANSPKQWGQALTEFALIAPLAFLLLAGAVTGGQLMVAAINLTQAARAGAVMAAQDYTAGTTTTQQTSDAVTAANDEEGGLNTITCTPTGSVPASCVSVTNTSESSSSAPEEVKVQIWQTVSPFIPLVSGISIGSSATAPAVAP